MTTAVPDEGCVIRDRIFSSVDLPAPFAPMMPTVSPLLISNETSLSAQITSSSAPSFENVVRLRRLAEVGQRAPNHVERGGAERIVPLLLGADAIPFRESIDGECGLDHDYATSANAGSLWTKYTVPDQSINSALIVPMPIEAHGTAVDPRRQALKPSMTPTSGFTA